MLVKNVHQLPLFLFITDRHYSLHRAPIHSEIAAFWMNFGDPTRTNLRVSASLAGNSTSCRTIRACEPCYATTGCHFCASDRQCHAYGSAYGCIYGASCEAEDGCIRKNPESLPYIGANFGEIILIVFLVGVVFTCAAVCIWSASLFKDAVSDTVEQSDERYIRLNRLSNAGQDAEDPNSDDTSDWFIPKKKVKITPSKALWILRICKCCWLVFVVSSIVTGVLVGINFPRKPIYNVCTESFNWSSILKSLTKVSLEADFDVVVSVKNPNRFKFAVSSLRVDFLHDSAVVGSAHDTTKLVLPPSSITDYILHVSFRPTLTQALSMQQDYYHGDLYFSLNGKVEGFTTPLGWEYKFEQEVDGVELRVGDAADTSLCKCP